MLSKTLAKEKLQLVEVAGSEQDGLASYIFIIIIITTIVLIIMVIIMIITMIIIMNIMFICTA